MIAEPYICKHDVISTNCGEIKWFSTEDAKRLDSSIWQPYADFEREKLKRFHTHFIVVDSTGPYWMCAFTAANKYRAEELIGYTTGDYLDDSESSRLLKRAEFLKAVCEKEGLEWLPQPIRTPMMQACDKFPKDNGPSPEGEEPKRTQRYFPHDFSGVNFCRFCGVGATTHDPDSPCPDQIAERSSPEGEEPSFYSKGDRELKDDLRDLYIGMAVAELKKEERKWRWALLNYLSTFPFDPHRDALGRQINNPHLEQLRREYL